MYLTSFISATLAICNRFALFHRVQPGRKAEPFDRASTEWAADISLSASASAARDTAQRLDFRLLRLLPLFRRSMPPRSLESGVVL